MSRNFVPPDGITNLTIGTKIKRWLTGFFNSVDVANGANAAVNTLQRSTAYNVGDIVQSDLVHAKYRLVCTTAGTTGSTAPDFTGKTVGSTVADGTTLVWTVREFATIESESIGDTDTPVYVTGGKVASIGSTLFSKIVTHLASATAASISSLNTSSLFYRMLSWALTASGVQYNFTNSSAWYICFGSLLGGLIIQGGEQVFENGGSGQVNIIYPLLFPTIAGLPMIILRTSAPTAIAASYTSFWRAGFDCRYTGAAQGGSAIWYSIGW